MPAAMGECVGGDVEDKGVSGRWLSMLGVCDSWCSSWVVDDEVPPLAAFVVLFSASNDSCMLFVTISESVCLGLASLIRRLLEGGGQNFTFLTPPSSSGAVSCINVS